MIISKWCQDGEHGWCANRNYDECHCECSCHKEKAEAVRQKRLAPVIAEIEKNREQQKAAIERAKTAIREK